MARIALRLTSPWRGVLRSSQRRAAAWFGSASYGRKWLVLGALIGMIAGIGAIVFYEALGLATHLLLGGLAGYKVPTPVGEGRHAASARFTRPWAIPVITSLGALASGILVFRVAPDAEGHGTDAAIHAVHHDPRGIRVRTVLVKIVASALTIGSGGSGGREGPTGQISAGFGSFLARLFDLNPADARIAVASGIGSGIGSIFGAPLGGAMLATEIMYRDDFEVDALLPAFIASIVGYAVFASFEGFSPLFGYVENYRLTNASQLLWFALIGILGGAVGLLYAKGFYGLADTFGRLAIPRWARPALGGLVVGCIALGVPQVLGTGYGWIQQALGPQLLRIPLWIVLLLPLARITTTGLSIGSGGSGGIFGPGMVIGAFVGASVWRVFEPVVPSLGHDPAPYVIVGMMACFGSISRAPLAVMLMVAEMTGTLTLIVPAMVAVGLATLIVRRSDDTIYRSQLRSRLEAPAHRILTGLPLLADIPASRAMARPRCVLAEMSDLATAEAQMDASGVAAAPVVDGEGRYLGAVRIERLRAARRSTGVEDLTGLLEPSYVPIRGSEHLDVVLDTLTSTPQAWAPVVDDGRELIGTIAISDLVPSYRLSLQENLRRVSEMSGPTGSLDVVVAKSSSLVGESLQVAGLPRGVLVTAVERGRELLRPTGSTVLCAGDRLTVLGASDDLNRLQELAAGRQVD